MKYIDSSLESNLVKSRRVRDGQMSCGKVIEADPSPEAASRTWVIASERNVFFLWYAYCDKAPY